MKKEFEEAKLEMIHFVAMDIITASQDGAAGNGSTSGGGTEFDENE